MPRLSRQDDRGQPHHEDGERMDRHEICHTSQRKDGRIHVRHERRLAIRRIAVELPPREDALCLDGDAGLVVDEDRHAQRRRAKRRHCDEKRERVAAG